MLPRILQELIGWLQVVPSVAGVVVCALFASRSRWVWLLMGGFAAEALVAAGYRVATLLLSRGNTSAAAFGGAFLALSLIGLLARTAIVGGLAALLAERAAWPRPSTVDEP